MSKTLDVILDRYENLVKATATASADHAVMREERDHARNLGAERLIAVEKGNSEIKNLQAKVSSVQVLLDQRIIWHKNATKDLEKTLETMKKLKQAAFEYRDAVLHEKGTSKVSRDRIQRSQDDLAVEMNAAQFRLDEEIPF